MKPPRSSPGRLGHIVLVCASFVAAAGACSSAATPIASAPSNAPGPTLIVTASVAAPTTGMTVEVTATPAPTASSQASILPPPPKPPATAVPIATPVPRPNITGDPPTFTPAPACGVTFKISVDVQNDGEARMLGEALAIIVVSRTEAGGGERFLYKDPFTIPALMPDAHIHLGETKRLTKSGHYTVTAYLDSSLWVTESRETDNNPSSTFDIPFGPGCSKA